MRWGIWSTQVSLQVCKENKLPCGCEDKGGHVCIEFSGYISSNYCYKMVMGYISVNQILALRNKTFNQSPKRVINMWIMQDFLTWVGGELGDSILDVGRGAYDPDLKGHKIHVFL